MSDSADGLIELCKRHGIGAAELLGAMQKRAEGHRRSHESPEQAFARAFAGPDPPVPGGNAILAAYNQLEQQRQYG